MSRDASVPADQLAPGQVRRAGTWAVGNRDGELFAVSRRCRHQLADLSKGTVDADEGAAASWAERVDGVARVLAEVVRAELA